MPFHAVIFDLDGTLLDTLADIGESANAALERLGFPTHPLDDYRTFVGDGVTVLMRRVLPESERNSAMVERAVAEFRKIYGKNWNRWTRPYEGIVELLNALAARQVALAVLSNKPHDFTVQCVREFLPQHQFAAVIGQREGVPTKPDSSAANEIVKQIGLNTAEIAYVGDTSIDMQTAVQANLYPIGVAWGFRSIDELRTHGAKKIVARPAELLQFF